MNKMSRQVGNAREWEEFILNKIRSGDADAWEDLIRRYEGRLFAFLSGRVRSRQAAEDLVQETLVGFLVSLPNYDGRRSLETWLFAIAAHKLTDYLRREGRRGCQPLEDGDDEHPAAPCGMRRQRGPSTVAGSRERKTIEERALAKALSAQVSAWKMAGDWQKLSCAELLFLRGLTNKEAAERLGVSEQQVANWKFDFLRKLRQELRRLGLPESVLPTGEAEK